MCCVVSLCGTIKLTTRQLTGYIWLNYNLSHAGTASNPKHDSLAVTPASFNPGATSPSSHTPCYDGAHTADRKWSLGLDSRPWPLVETGDFRRLNGVSEQAILCTWMIRSGFISSFVACGSGREKGFCPALESADSLRWVISYTCSANRCPCVCLHTCTSSAHGLYLLLLAIFFL